MKKQTKSDTTSTPAAGPKGKGSLIGRGALIKQLVAEETPLALFISTVRQKYPVCGPAWCERMFKKAHARLAKKAAAQKPAPAPAPAAAPAVPEKSTRKSRKAAAAKA
jgi:hypothetical protein